MKGLEGERTAMQRNVRRKQRKRGPLAAIAKFLLPHPAAQAVIGGLEAKLNKDDLTELAGLFGDKWKNTALESYTNQFEEDTLAQADQYDPGKSALMGFIEGKIGESAKIKDAKGTWTTRGDMTKWGEKIGSKFKIMDNLFAGAGQGSNSTWNILSGATTEASKQFLTDWKPLIEQSAIGARPIAAQRPKTTSEIYRYFSQMSPNV